MRSQKGKSMKDLGLTYEEATAIAREYGMKTSFR
jgi:hypothetical protein